MFTHPSSAGILHITLLNNYPPPQRTQARRAALSPLSPPSSSTIAHSRNNIMYLTHKARTDMSLQILFIGVCVVGIYPYKAVMCVFLSGCTGDL